MSQVQSKFLSEVIVGGTATAAGAVADVATDVIKLETSKDSQSLRVKTGTSDNYCGRKRIYPTEMPSPAGLTLASESGSVKKLKISPMNQLILTTTYELNNSCSKKVVVGLEIQAEDGSFEPMIRFLDNKSRGVSLNLQEWNQLQQKFDVISDYFEGGCNSRGSAVNNPPSPIKIDRHKLFFTTSYNAKAILIGRILQKDEISPTNTAQGKKEGLYMNNTVMQLPTYEGLYNLVICIDERMRGLEKISSDVKLCKNLFVAALCDYFVSEKIAKPTAEFVRQLLNVKFEFFKQQVKPKLSPEFASQYFEIVFCEMTSLLNSYVSYEVKENMCQKLKKNTNES